jgi:hypothetical protein
VAVQRITGAGGEVSRGPVLLYGVILTGVIAAASVNLYDGTSASDRLRAVFFTAAAESVPLPFPLPMMFEHGLFVSFGAAADQALFFYEPVREEQLPPASDVPVE